MLYICVLFKTQFRNVHCLLFHCHFFYLFHFNHIMPALYFQIVATSQFSNIKRCFCGFIFGHFLWALYRTHFHNWLQKSWGVIKMMCFFTVQLLRDVKVGLIVIILMWRSVLFLRILNWYLIKEYISTFWRKENNLTGIFLVFPPQKSLLFLKIKLK